MKDFCGCVFHKRIFRRKAKNMIYYHFLKSEYAMDDLEKKRIRVSILDFLNDPFELKPYLAFKERASYNEVRKKINKKWGLLCFSKDWRESLLWGHYADKHHGIALGFEIHGGIKKVKYISKRVKIDLTKSNEENEKLFLKRLAFRKYKNWKYEKEYRMWVELNKCKKDEDSEGGYYVEFNENLKIKEIILGCRFNYERKAEKIKELAKINDVSIIIPTREEWSWFRVNPCGTKQGKFFQEFKRF